MSGLCNITNKFTNKTSYSFAPTASSSLSSGNWVTSPQPLAANADDFVAFEAVGVNGTATGAVGVAVYNVMSNGAAIGTLSLTFSDPYTGSNSGSASTTVDDLVVSCDIPSDGRTITAKWKAK
jgi:hypothetical protein